MRVLPEGFARFVVMVIVLIVLVGSLGSSINAISYTPTQSGWGIFNVSAGSIVVYDYDEDGIGEVIVSPNTIIDGQTLFHGVYFGLRNLTVIDGFLVSYSSAGYTIYNGSSVVYTSDKPVIKVFKDLTGEAGIVGDTLIYNGSLHKLDLSSNYIAVALYKGMPIIAYYSASSSTMFLYYNGETLNLGIDLVPLAAFVAGENLYVLSASSEGLVFISFEGVLSSKFKTIGVSLPPNSNVVGFDIPELSFIVYYNGVAYLVGPSGLITLTTGRPICSDGLKLFLLEKSFIQVFDGVSGTVVGRLPIPPINALIASCSDGTLAVSDGERIAVYYPVPKPYINIVVERSAYVLEPVSYRIDYSNTRSIIVLLNDTIIQPRGVLSFNRSGTYKLEVHASNGFIESQDIAYIVVLPRPITIDIKLDSPPVAFENDNITVEVYDSLNNGKAYTSCNLSIPNVGEFQVVSWRKVGVPIIPSSRGYSIGVTCGGDDVYKQTFQSFQLEVQPSPSIIRVIHPYQGVILFEAVNKLGQLIKGKITVYCCNKIFEGDNPLVFKLWPGKHNATVTFTPDINYYSRANRTITIFYPTNATSSVSYSNQSSVTVYIEKIPVNVTRTLTKEISIPVPKHIITYNKEIIIIIAITSSVLSVLLFYLMEKYGWTSRIMGSLFKRQR